ncbi:MAG: BrnT family toxin [bacterium]|nr:BrnT family toxin [bacterium]
MPIDILERLIACTGFDWDEGNLLKNWEKHGVTVAECEQVFFNRPLLARPDEGHSLAETRFYLLGKADSGRRLFVVFTIREQHIRVISARNQSRKERRSYERYGEEN